MYLGIKHDFIVIVQLNNSVVEVLMKWRVYLCVLWLVSEDGLSHYSDPHLQNCTFLDKVLYQGAHSFWTDGHIREVIDAHLKIDDIRAQLIHHWEVIGNQPVTGTATSSPELNLSSSKGETHVVMKSE